MIKPFLNNVKNNNINFNIKRNFSIDSKIIFQSKLENLSQCSSFKLEFKSLINLDRLNFPSLGFKNFPPVFNEKKHLFTIESPNKPQMGLFFIKEIFYEVDETSAEFKDLEEKITLFRDKELEIRDSLLKIGILYKIIDFKYPPIKSNIKIILEDHWKLIQQLLIEIKLEENNVLENIKELDNDQILKYIGIKLREEAYIDEEDHKICESELSNLRKIKKYIINSDKDNISEGDLIIEKLLLFKKENTQEELLRRIIFIFLFTETKVVQILLEYLLLSEFGLITFLEPTFTELELF